MNLHCAQRSMGDWVTGNPVKILRYAANFDNRIKAFVREAFGDLIAVDSSTARSALDDLNGFKKLWTLGGAKRFDVHNQHPEAFCGSHEVNHVFL